METNLILSLLQVSTATGLCQSDVVNGELNRLTWGPGVELLLLLPEEELAEVVRASDKDASWAPPPLGGLSGHDRLGGGTEADPTCWRDRTFLLASERLGIPLEELANVAGETDIWNTSSSRLPPRPYLG